MSGLGHYCTAVQCQLNYYCVAWLNEMTAFRVLKGICTLLYCHVFGHSESKEQLRQLLMSVRPSMALRLHPASDLLPEAVKDQRPRPARATMRQAMQRRWV